MDGEHRARDLRRDLHQVAAHIRVIGRLVVLAVQEVPRGEPGAGKREHREHAEEKDSSFHCIATFAS